MASSSSSSSSKKTLNYFSYDVFISFRGEDTRNNFTSHLYSALDRTGIRSYKDDGDLKRGDAISTALMEAIKASRLSLIIFSRNYASSSWCLDELVQILECKRTIGQIVIPVFYEVAPTNVRKQNETLLAQLERRFGNSKMRNWRACLTAAANFSGWDSQVTKPDSKLVEAIVEDVLKKLNCTCPINIDVKSLVGIDERVNKVVALLHTGVRFICIWGMGGIGKTTLAKAVFAQISTKFGVCCFLENVREEWVERRNKHHLAKKLYSQLLDNPNTSQVFGGLSTFDVRRLSQKNALIILDDVSDPEQIEFLVGPQNGTTWLGPQSRVIVTTRDRQVLRNIKDVGVHEVEQLKSDEALSLFHKNAFREDSTERDNVELIGRFVKYARGNPLALKVLASLLCGKCKEKWRGELDKLEKIPPKEVQNVLRISYDGLDRDQKEIFLDIACFYKGKSRDTVERILDGCGFCTSVEIDALLDKSLINVFYNHIYMHDLVQKMGREIVFQEHVNASEFRSRLWVADDILPVLENNLGPCTRTIKGISLDVSNIADVHLNPRAFSHMHNLRMLSIHSSNEFNIWKLHIHEDIESLPNSLRYLHWNKYPSKYLPPNFTMENLVKLNLSHSKLHKLWDGNKNLKKLKTLVLSDSKELSEIPDFSQSPNLEHVRLDSCTSLAQFPQLHRNITFLNLSDTAIKHMPMAIQYLSNLEVLSLNNCKKLESLSTMVYKLECLTHLSLSGCSKFQNLPEILEPMKRLSFLELDRTAIKELPSSISNLVALEFLILNNCKNLELIPDSIEELACLDSLEISCCTRLESLPKVSFCLENLDARGCTSLEFVPLVGILASQYWDGITDCYPGGTFNFVGCPCLSEVARRHIMCDALLRVFRMASISSYARANKKHLGTHATWYPADQIPKCVKHQFQGPSVQLDVPKQWCNDTFLGFVVSALVNFDGCFLEQSIDFNVEYCIMKNCSSTPNDSALWDKDILALGWDSVSYEGDERINVDVDHVLLLYLYVESWFEFDFATRVAFRFFSNDANCAIKACGAHLLYDEEVYGMLYLLFGVTRDEANLDSISVET